MGAVAARCGLTPREEEIALRLAQGYSASRIAADISVSESTVRFHTKNVYTKCGVHSKQDFIALVTRG